MFRIALILMVSMGILGGLASIANIVVEVTDASGLAVPLIVLTVLVVGFGALDKLADYREGPRHRRPTVAQIRRRKRRCG